MNVPVDWEIPNLAKIEIIRKSGSKPSVSWITSEKAKTPSAKKRIKAYFRKENRKEAIQIGKNLYSKYLKIIKKNYGFKPKEVEKYLLLEEHEVIESIYELVFSKRLSFYNKLGKILLMLIFKRYSFSQKNFDNSLEDIISEFFLNGIIPDKNREGFLHKLASGEISLTDMENVIYTIKKADAIAGTQKKEKKINHHQSSVPISFAKCCQPIKGDKIVAYSTHFSLKIHRQDCINIIRIDNVNQNKNRLIPITWNSDLLSREEKIYNVSLNIELINNSISCKLEIQKIIESSGTKIIENYQKYRSKRLSKVFMNFVITIRNTIELEKLISRINQIDEVAFVTRDII